MRFVNDIMDRLLGKSSEGKNYKFFSLEGCVSKMLEDSGIDSMHDKGKFAMEFQGDRCVFNMALNCLDGNRLMVYVLFPIPIADDVACAASYEVKRVAKGVAAAMPDIEVRLKKDDEGFSVFACMVKDFETLTTETPNEIYEEMIRTVNVLDGENFDRLVAAIFGYKSYEEAKHSMRLGSVGENDMILNMEDGYYKLLAETPNINCSRYTGRLKIYIQHIIDTKENGKEQISFLHIDTFDDYIQEAYNMANDDERDLIRKLRFLMAADDGSVIDLNIGEYEAEYLISKNPLQLLYYGEDNVDDDDKIDDTEEIAGDSEEEWLYSRLTKKKYKKHPYEQRNLGENMTLVNQEIYGYWKPRYLLDNVSKTAVEFLSESETLMNVADEDIDWESIKSVSQDVMARIESRSFHFPGYIYDYKNGIAKVRWEVNPDGMYYRDEDGFGMTDDDEINLEGAIDRQGKVVKKFSLKQ